MYNVSSIACNSKTLLLLLNIFFLLARLISTPSVPNCRSFDFFDPKFDHPSYSKICAKYDLFCCGLLYQYKIFKNDLNLAIFA